MRAYFERIPVVALDGEELFDFVVDEGLCGSAQRGRAHVRRSQQPSSRVIAYGQRGETGADERPARRRR